jgi:sugar phosphate isomerase/epimerase
MKPINRRNFLRNTAMASAGIMTSFSLLAQVQQRKLPAIGFISGIVSNFLKEDWKGTMTTLASMGYTELEGGWNLGQSPKEMVSFSKGLGIQPFAGGLGLVQLLDGTEAHIEKALQCENEYLICYWPWLDGADNITADQCRKSAETLNRLGEMCKKSGLKFCWHNHDKEFLKDTGEGLPYDLLMKWTDPGLVSVELDIYWAKKGGADSLDLLKKYPGRTPILHVKDMDSETRKDFACPGSGIIDFVPVFSEALNQGVTHYIVERDGETDGINCLKGSSDYLKRIRV